MVQDATLGPCGARIVVHARVDALHVDAGVIARTVAVAVTANHAAAIQRVAVIALAATAIGNVVVREALGVGAARGVRDQARVHAVVVLAGLVARALAVVLALDRVTRDFRIALIALLARAHRFVVLYVADRAGAAVARVAALPVDAGLAVAAIVIRRASADDRQLYCGSLNDLMDFMLGCNLRVRDASI